MPEPIINLQRRLTIVGAIRLGGEKPERGVGRKLEALRITSPRRELIEQAAQLYGGPVTPWHSPVGDEWQVYTEAVELPVLVMPSYSLRLTYELWEGATKRTRLCDGTDEELSGGPCICNAEGVDRCDIYTRFVVALPELDTVLGWKLTSTGANAARELPTMMHLVETVGAGQTFVPARLRIDQRRGVKDGQVVRYVVPVLDLGVGYLALAGDGRRGLPSGGETFVPAESRVPTLRQSLSAAVSPTEPTPPGGRQVALGPEFPPEEGAPPLPVEDGAPEGTYTDERQTKLRTEPQAAKLNVLVGQLRQAGKVTTVQLYKAVGEMRGVDPEQFAVSIGAVDADGLVHWHQLRDVLTRPEASDLIDRLELLEKAGSPPGASAGGERAP